jgi:O-antigen ligase
MAYGPGVTRARAALVADAALPALLVVYCAFNAGGYFPDTPALVAAGLLVMLALRVVLTPAPFAGWGASALLGAGLLGLLAAWSIASQAWSHAPGRAVIEASRVAAYGLALLTVAAVPWTPGRLRRHVRALAAAAAAVCLAALASRLTPGLWPSPPNILPERLSYPLTYWNALALLAALGMVLCGALAADADEPRLNRALAAAAFPVLWVTALLTFSRGGLAVALLALAAYALLARPRGLARAILATLPASAAAVAAGYTASALATAAPPGAAGSRVALVVIGAAVLAGALMWRPPGALRRREARLAAGGRPRGRRAMLVAAVVAGVALAPFAVRQVQGFSGAPSAAARADQRHRLTDPSANGRLEYWRVAWRAFSAHPLRGEGAGTYVLAWARERRVPAPVTHAHSLYLETLAELGVPGLALVLAALAAVLAGLARRRAGPDAMAATALLVATGAWLLHAALDWDWQMPAVTIWLWTSGGAALARAAGRGGLGLAPRAAIAVGLVAAAGAPGLLALNERKLEAAEAAYRAGRCTQAEALARSADAALPLRPEPPAIEGFCAARRGDRSEARRLLARAVSRDPGDWELRYDQAVVQAATGADPAAALAAARARNPLQPDLQTWKRRAVLARLFLLGLDEPPLGGSP